jgi:hypothetical protein
MGGKLDRGRYAGLRERKNIMHQLNTKTAKHYFCKHCGIHPFTRPRLDPSLWVVNVRCLDEVDLASLAIRLFDGEHWDEAAKAFYSQQRKQPVA